MSQPSKPEWSRRQFLGRSAQQAAGVAAGIVALGGAVHSAEHNAQRVRLGVIGLRNQGRTLLETLLTLPAVEIAGLCDVDSRQFAPCLKIVAESGQPAPLCVSDFRSLLDDAALDAVVIATPDHWHVPMTVLACQAGKDVYLESPATHAYGDGPLLLAAAESAQRVVQVGLQQRSGVHFQSAIQAVQGGEIGAVKQARAWVVHRRKPMGQRSATESPATVDYRQWLGPAPERAFHANRFHFNWRWFWDYGGGELAHWGVHWLDVARWGLGVELPQRVSAVGSAHGLSNDQETPDLLSVQYDFGDTNILWEHRLWSGHGLENRSSGVAFYGDQGTLILDRGGWKIYDSASSLTAGSSDLLQTHLANFLDCIRSRRQPTAHLSVGVCSSALCHLGNAAYRLQRELRMDELSGNTAAQTLLHPPARPGWRVADLLKSRVNQA